MSGENKIQRLERLAEKFVVKLRGGPRRGAFEGRHVHVALASPKDSNRETIRGSMMMEFSDLWQTTNRAENVRIRAKIADAVDRWIESHVKLIGEIFFCDDPNGK